MYLHPTDSAQASGVEQSQGEGEHVSLLHAVASGGDEGQLVR